MSLATARKLYAEEIRESANLQSEAIVKAFETVPRENFLGPGPWKVKSIGEPYSLTPNADPIHLYSNTLVAIDAVRGLNNGLPTWIARTIEVASPVTGDKVVHIGAGVGYYTAILAELVGPSGHVVGIEIDATLAARARENLSSMRNVTIENTDGSSFNPGLCDVVFVNAGASCLQAQWLDSLKQGGRLVVPLTYSFSEPGRLFKITKSNDELTAKAMHEVFIYPCFGSRNVNSDTALRGAIERHGWEFSGVLRRDPENADSSCWLASDAYWFSRIQ